MEQKDFLEIISAKLSGINQNEKSFAYGQYNIFEVLGIESNEVRICRFLADLLDPKGKHGCDILFLKLFMDMLGGDFQIYDDSLLKNTTVFTEYPIDNDRRIDIVISNAKVFLPIEVKIYAGEQKDQCHDYYTYAKTHHNSDKLIYLTRFGSFPSDYSTCGDDEVISHTQCISFASDIRGMLEKSLLEINNPFVKMLVELFLDTIKKHSDPLWKEKEDMFEELYKNKDYFCAAVELEKHLGELKKSKTALIMKLMSKLEIKITNECKSYFDSSGTDKNINWEHYYLNCTDRFYDSKKSTFPGFAYSLKTIVLGEKKLDIQFRVEIDNNLYAGIFIYDLSAEKEYVLTNKEKNLVSLISEIINGEIEENGCWPSWEYLPIGTKDINSDIDENNKGSDIVPNFKEMNDAALKLADEGEMDSFVDKCVDIIKVYLEKTIKKPEDNE